MFDITAFLDKNFIEQRESGDDIMVNCPFCLSRAGKDDTKQHLGVSMERQVVHCFRCDYSNNWIGFVMDYLGVNYITALGMIYRKPKLRDTADILAVMEAPVIEPKAFSKLPKGFRRIEWGNKSSMANVAAWTYLNRRGFTAWHADRYNLGIASSVENRVVIPIEEGYWQARSIYEWMAPKYMNPPIEAGDLLFNAQALTNYSEVVVCEGAFSAMAVGENAIALISKEPTKERLKRILSSDAEHIIIALEPGAFKSMRKLADAATRAGRRVTLWSYSKGDPADPSGQFAVVEYSLRNKLEIIMDEGYQERRAAWRKAWLGN